MKKYMIANISLLIFLLSPLALIIFLVKPALLNNKIKRDLSRKKIIGLFAGLMTASFVLVGIFAEPVSQIEETVLSPMENVVELDEQVLGKTTKNLKSTPTYSPSPMPSLSPTPTPTSAPTPTAVTIVPTAQPTSLPSTSQSTSTSYDCNCSKTCPKMSSCAEAQYQLNVCGCTRRDGDNDGIACDADCQ